MAAAVRLGYQGLAVLRGDAAAAAHVPWVRTLDGVLGVVGPPGS